MQPGLADIRGALRIAQHLLAKPFKLAATYVFKVDALGPLRGGLIEVDRDVIALPDFAPGLACELDAILNGDALDGDKRNHIGCAPRADARRSDA